MAKIRTFVAVDISPRIQNSAARLIEKMQSDATGYRWNNPENLHIGLNFLGDVLENETPQVCRLVSKACNGVAAFPIEVGQLGCFPSDEKPRTIWLGVTEGAEFLVDLNDRIATELAEMGFPRDRQDYHPHVILGRLQRGGHWSQALVESRRQHENHLAGGCVINQVVVYSSFMDRVGPTYTPMSRINLR